MLRTKPTHVRVAIFANSAVQDSCLHSMDSVRVKARSLDILCLAILFFTVSSKFRRKTFSVAGVKHAMREEDTSMLFFLIIDKLIAD